MANLGTIQNTGSAADGADPDGDGWTNSDERPAGTDPNDRASALKIDQIQARGDDMVITFKTVSGKTYAIMSSSSLEPNLWEVARTQGLPQENIRGDGGMMQITDTDGALHPRRSGIEESDIAGAVQFLPVIERAAGEQSHAGRIHHLGGTSAVFRVGNGDPEKREG